MIPKTHPRYKSLMLREKIIDGWKKGIVATAGLIAHGRGEAFDYMLGEKTTLPAKKAIKAAAASLLLSKNPVISVNGNTAALSAKDVVKLAEVIGGKIEVNLFHRTVKRARKIKKILMKAGAKEVLGIDEKLKHIDVDSNRSTASPHGIYNADTVLVPLEDGDRTEALVKSGKTVIAIDLNPLSRTSQTATISIVDNIVRALPKLYEEVVKLKNKNKEELKEIIEKFDNKKNLEEVLKLIEIERYKSHRSSRTSRSR
ncbi:pantothenate synthetase [Methanothermus fervidus DSM 2088]|uniref:4-phosphopantoate--beta-alanine ligase n=1 Tax=Methanothermus fervidus (strain ATCC 43054 / DSM 2088 / JCM 10308 / V24 S) TaxID=523846 RepID=E3GYS3_METFV|nr:4-phosphopantoate--beta-alanine ligase [Methanothermus fervidus]ADP77455.1 pantothenate synthetase [Methanothermus fervidus DSM 2088]